MISRVSQQDESATLENSMNKQQPEFVQDVEMTVEECAQLSILVEKHRKEVLQENPTLATIPKPFGFHIAPGFEEHFLSIKAGEEICGFVSYNTESRVMNETGLYIEPAYRGKGFALALLGRLLALAVQNTLRAIYFYNLTSAGRILLEKFEYLTKENANLKLRFSYQQHVVTITMQDVIGCSNFEEHNKLLPCFVPYERDQHLMVVDAKGNYIFTDHGKLLDMNSGYWCCPFGYRHPELEPIMREGYFSHLFGYLHPSAISLAQKLCEISGMERAGFNTSGSSVVDEALRLAWQYSRVQHGPDRTIVVSFKGGFYGSSTTGLTAAGLKINGHTYKHYLPVSDLDRKIDPFSSSPNPLEELIEREGLHGKISTFLFEPVLGVRGAYELDKKKLQAMMETCKRYAIITIADEISTAMGRTGELLACNHYHIQPDMICLGKPITNGMFPLAAVLINGKINSIFTDSKPTPSDYLYGSTLSGHPTGCMIALKVLALLQDPATLDRIRELSERILNGLLEFQNRFSIVKSIHGIGLMLGIELTNSRMAQDVQFGLRRLRINCIPEGAILMIMPPYTLTDEELAYFLASLEKVLSEINTRKGK